MNCKILLIGCILLLGKQVLLAQQVADGPFVRYQAGKLTVSVISKEEERLIPRTDTVSSRNSLTLNVTPEDHPEWRFNVRLRDTLLNDPGSYLQAVKTLFISDIEGEFANFRQLLLGAKVIDEKYNWIYGKAALIIPGDLFDRGRDVVPELWLLYKLEDEAKAAGGSVQVILGNHDVMNLSGDHRYTDAKYFKEAWLLKTGIDSLFTKNTELGRWLRTKNVIEKCGEVLVMHGGLSPAILDKQVSLAQLNTLCRPCYDLARKGLADSLQVYFGKDALFWYRGYFMGKKATAAQVDSTLKLYHCKWILVGHTITTKNIASYYKGKVIGVDVDEHANNMQAALLENGKWYVVHANGSRAPLVYDPANDQLTDKDIL